MTTFDIAAVPLAPKHDPSGSSAARKDDSGTRGHAWQLEMERAQMENWLSHTVIGHGHSASVGLLPSALATGASTVPGETASQDEPVSAGSLPAAPAPAASGSAGSVESTATAQGAQLGALARGLGGDDQVGASSLDVSATRQGPSLPPVASELAREATASHPHGLAPGLSIAAATAVQSHGSPHFEAHAFSRPPLQFQHAGGGAGASVTAPSGFNSASLNQALQQFGSIVATTTPVSAESTVNARAGMQAEKLLGLSRAEQVIAIAASRASELPRGLEVAAGMHSNLQLRPHAPHQRSAGPADRAGRGQGAGAGASEPIRVQADWSDEGVRVWLGMDSGALDSLPQISAALQAWLNAQGLRMRSLTCNGQIVSEEPEWPGPSDDTSVPFDSAEIEPESTAKELS